MARYRREAGRASDFNKNGYPFAVPTGNLGTGIHVEQRSHRWRVRPQNTMLSKTNLLTANDPHALVLHAAQPLRAMSVDVIAS